MRESTLRTADQSLLVLLAIMTALVLAGLTFLLAHWSDHFYDRRVTQEVAFERMSNLAGPDAVDCGRISYSDDPAAGTACIEEVQRAGKPFLLAREGRIFEHGDMWFGFTRNARGQQYVVAFSTRTAMGDMPNMHVWACPRLKLVMDNGDPGPACARDQYSLPSCWNHPGPASTPHRRKPPSGIFCWGY